MSDITWRPVVGAPNYEVSSDGQVRSIDHTIQRSDGQFRNIKGRVLRPGTTRYGYQLVRFKIEGSKGTTRKVHRLVCFAFHGDPLPGQVVRHLNGNPADNRVENLAWGSPSENMYDRVRHGNHYQVNKTHCPRNHPLEVRIRRRDGKKSRVCRTCERERNEKLKVENPDKWREYMQRHDAKRRTGEAWEKRLAQHREWYHRTREERLVKRRAYEARKKAERAAISGSTETLGRRQ